MTPDRRSFLAGCAALSLSRCGALVELPGQGPAPANYDLRGAVPKSFAPGPKIPLQIAVLEPIAVNGLDTDRIAVRPVARRVDYYANARWTDRVPALTQSLLLQALNLTDRVSAARSGGLAADVNLASELDAFDSVVDGGAARVEIEWHLRLVRAGSGRVIASRGISETEPAAGTDIAAVVQAFEGALQRALNGAVAFLLDELKGVRP